MNDSLGGSVLTTRPSGATRRDHVVGAGISVVVIVILLVIIIDPIVLCQRLLRHRRDWIIGTCSNCREHDIERGKLAPALSALLTRTGLEAVTLAT